jgi:hypothetical protein
MNRFLVGEGIQYEAVALLHLHDNVGNAIKVEIKHRREILGDTWPSKNLNQDVV